MNSFLYYITLNLTYYNITQHTLFWFEIPPDSRACTYVSCTYVPFSSISSLFVPPLPLIFEVCKKKSRHEKEEEEEHRGRKLDGG